MSIGRTIVDLKSLRGTLLQHESVTRESVHQAAADVARQTPAISEVQLVASWNKALGELDDSEDDNNSFSISDPLISRLQTYFAEQADTDPTTQLQISELPGAVKEVKFDDLDPGWWGRGIGIGLRKLFAIDPTDWVTPNPSPSDLPEGPFRVALFADWGSGLYGAPKVAEAIVRTGPYHLVMHLGDTYYAGSKSEIAQRLTGTAWPAVPGAINRSLNGNHEMYSGGAPYFDALKTFFQQDASCFAMQNSKWLLIALDSAYIDGTIEDEKTKQITWLKNILAQAGQRKIILFSHHQPFSQLDREKNSKKMQRPIQDILESGRIHAWFFGHEHRCVVYDPHPKWGLKGRCIGNGGFPAFRDKFQIKTPAGKDFFWQELAAREENKLPKAFVLDGPNPGMPGETERYSPHGYVTLDFNNGDCVESYFVPHLNDPISQLKL